MIETVESYVFTFAMMIVLYPIEFSIVFGFGFLAREAIARWRR